MAESKVNGPHPSDLLSANLPIPGSSRPDPRLRQAMEQACRQQQVTPILKEELRAAIMLRRLSSGQGEVTLTDSPAKEYKLTPDEIAKQEKRRAQNRRAAQRCRKKKRQEQEEFLQVFSQQDEKRQKLEQEVTELREEKRRLEDLLANHMLSRACRKVNTSVSGQYETFPQAITCETFADDSFYDIFHNETKWLRGHASGQSLPSDLDPELPVEESSLLLSLDSRQYLSGLAND